MPLSWNEIKDRGLAFSRKWEDEESEDAEAKSFWDDFFDVCRARLWWGVYAQALRMSF